MGKETKPFAFTEYSAVLRYGMAVGAVAVAAALWLALDPLFGRTPYTPFGIAVILAAIFGGRGAGLAATALGLLTFRFLCLQPRYRFALPRSRSEAIVFVAGVAVAVFLALTLGKLRESLASQAESAETTQAVLESSAQAIVGVGDDRRIALVNTTAQRIFGYTREELLGQPLGLLIPERLRTQVAAFMAAPNPRPIRAEGDMFGRRKDGSEFPVEITLNTVPTRRGALDVSFVTDVTERKQAEEERARLEAQLQRAQKLESIGRLAGGVAHDFNNLLTVINGYSDLILGTLQPQDPQRESLAEIRRAGGRAVELTRQLLAFSRKQMIAPRPVNLNSLIADSRDMFRRLVGEDIEVVMDLDAELGQVMADAGQLNQVLMNLVVNARDAMPAGGRITLRSSRMHLDEDAAASFRGAVPGLCAVMEVSDTGEGMSEEIQQNLFEPFFTTKSMGKGTGLGLSTVYGIVQQAGGWIRVESQPGKGATFRIGLPLTEQPATRALPETPAPARMEGFETILVVEDQDEVRRLVLAVLTRFHYRTLEAGSGGEALRIAEGYPGPIHLLLTDVVMPRMTGKQLADRLRAVRPSMKVVYMSGYAADVISRQGVMDSGIEFIKKPFSPETLALKVRSVLWGGSIGAKGAGGE
jgi:PAS domain S-box-containing protein